MCVCDLDLSEMPVMETCSWVRFHKGLWPRTRDCLDHLALTPQQAPVWVQMCVHAVRV